jgi:3-hydroxyisobutyrate dehydrogenase
MAKIGFIGLGKMGLPMARNLMKAGHQVTGFDVVPEAVAAFVTAGGTAAPSAAAAATGAEFVVSMLPAGQHVRAAMLGPAGAAAASPPGAVLIDSSTIDVATARALAAEAGRPVVDAPVSGGTMGAENGTLTFMVGGDAATFEKVKPILAGMGRTIVHCGAAGAGQVAKACNNMMLAINMIGVSEAMNMADQLGLPRQKLYDIVSTATGRSFALTDYPPVPDLVATCPANNDYKPGFAAALMAKDLGLAQEAAASVGVATPMGKAAAGFFKQFVDQGEGGKDFSAIIQFMRAMAR